MERTSKKYLDARENILNAALKRFDHFGYNKTTMEEIARDCDMSAANIYRYFKSKADVGKALAKIHITPLQTSLRDIVRSPGLSAQEKLKMLVLTQLRFHYNEFRKHPLLLEIVQNILKEKARILEEQENLLKSLMAEVLSEGNKTGEFDVPEIITTAELFLIATQKFTKHKIVTDKNVHLDKMESQATALIDLLVKGLAKR